MNNIEIYFDNNLMNLNDFDGTESISFVYRNKTESGDSGYSFSPELTLTGNAYDYVYNEIINKPNPALESIQVLVYDTCCLDDNGNSRLLFTGLIEGSDVRWCVFPNCYAQVTVIDNSSVGLAITCLKNIMPYDNANRSGNIRNNTRGIDEYRIAPYIYYCDDVKPDFTHEALMIMGIWFFILTTPILAILQFFNFLSGVDSNIFNDLGNLIVGCGKKHIAPYMDSYFKNMCKLCYLSYQSSLFDVGGYYHDTVRVDMAYKPGSQNDRDVAYANQLNQPNLNGIQFLDTLKEWNIDWRITNNTLVIERKDFFNGGLWFDTELLDDDQLLSICIEPSEKKPYAFAEYNYPKDGVDNSGDEVAPNWSQRAIDWNVPINPVLRGLFTKNFTFSASQFRFDNNRIDVAPIDKRFYRSFYPTLNDTQNDNAMLLEKGVANFPKLLDIGRTYDQNGFIYRGYGVVNFYENNNGLFTYNYKWQVFENPLVDRNGTSYDTAYQRLLCIDDPRNTSIKIRKFTLSVTADCNLLRGLSIDKFVRTPIGDGDIEEITYDVTNNSLTITGKI
jgi:hypothetical protein